MSDRQTETTTVEPVRRGFGPLVCLRCGETSVLAVDLSDLTDESAVHCHGCQANFGLADVVEAVEAWQKVLNWVSLAPLLSDES